MWKRIECLNALHSPQKENTRKNDHGIENNEGIDRRMHKEREASNTHHEGAHYGHEK
jgi:hypothetical protein